MKTILWIGLGIVTAVALVVAGLGVGWSLWGRSLWAAGPFAVPRMATGTGVLEDCRGWGGSMGPGMMGGGAASAAPCAGQGYGTGSSDALTIEEAHEAVERYIAALGYSNRSAERSRRSLEVAEVMEFERNFYAIVRESDTGIGAMELLVDKWTGAVGPEMGPNMMWNGRYGPALPAPSIAEGSLPNGMHGRGRGMMGGSSETNTITPEETLEIAQRWLDTYRPGVTVEEHADPFYGYYTIHTLKDGQIEGMLSVHGATGQVWYHTWHAEFIQMLKHDADH